MPRRHLGVVAAWSYTWLVCLLLTPLPTSAQETAPVTVVIQFEEPSQTTLGGTGGGNLGAATISPAGTTSLAVFNRVILPTAETRAERDTRQEEAAQRAPRRPRTFGGTFRYEHVDFDNESSGLDGNIYATNFQMAWDIEDFSVGVLVPYEYLDLRNFNTHQIGAILYGHYTMRLSPDYSLGLTVNGNYIYSAIDQQIPDVNTFGGGVGVSFNMDRDIWVLGGAISYQYNVDDTDNPNDHQHLLKFGANMGVRVGQHSVITLFSTWNYDVTDYKQPVSSTDDNYFDLGVEASWSITQTWNLNGGYKRTLGLRDFESNQFYIGTLLRF